MMFILLASTNRVPRCWITIAWIGHGSLWRTMAYQGDMLKSSSKKRLPKIQLVPFGGIQLIYFEENAPFLDWLAHTWKIVALLFCRTLETDNWPPASTWYTLELCTHNDVESHKNTPQIWFGHCYWLLLALGLLQRFKPRTSKDPRNLHKSCTAADKDSQIRAKSLKDMPGQI